jgi:hypothetical protein
VVLFAPSQSHEEGSTDQGQANCNVQVASELRLGLKVWRFVTPKLNWIGAANFAKFTIRPGSFIRRH